jgi:hemerythrin-like metal-binding protein
MSITWLNVYDTHIRVIDDQHRILVDMINDLADATGKENESKLIRDLFFKLVDNTKYHFTQEENLMTSSNYPKIAEHIGQHKAFVNQIVEMLEKIKEGNANISEKLNMFLMKWLIKHILGYDKEFANFYRIVSR